MAETEERDGSSEGFFFLRSAVQGVEEGEIGAVDGGGARAAVGFQHVAVDPEVRSPSVSRSTTAPQGSADETLDLDAAAIDLAAAIARLARVRAAGEHAVLGGQPALAGAVKNGGTTGSTQQVQRTVVRPMRTSTLPGAWRV